MATRKKAAEATPEQQPEAAQTEAQTEAQKQRDSAIRESYATAQKRLREKYEDEFNAMRLEEAQRRGVMDWRPRMKDEEKAQAQISELLAKYPGALDAVLAQRQGQGGPITLSSEGEGISIEGASFEQEQ
jgi:hypothetical protein